MLKSWVKDIYNQYCKSTHPIKETFVVVYMFDTNQVYFSKYASLNKNEINFKIQDFLDYTSKEH